MASILEVLPQPKRITIQGNTYLASQLQVRDIAVCQSYLEDLYPHPLDLARDDLHNLQGIERKRFLVKMKQNEASATPRFPSAEADYYFGYTLAGLAYWLFLILGKYEFNGITPELAIILAENMTQPEKDALDKIAWNISPSSELHRLMYPGSGDGGEEREDEMAAAIDAVCCSHGLTYEQVGEMTLSQFAVAVSGKSRRLPPARDLSHLSAAQIKAQLEKDRKEFGLEEPNGDQ